MVAIRQVSADQNSELAACVRAWRHRLVPEDRQVVRRRRARRSTVTQEEIAEIVGVSVVWYSNLERGVRANYSDAFLDAVAEALRLDRRERELLYLLAVGRMPAPSTVGATAVVLGPALRQFVEGQRWATYVLDRYARVVLHNEVCEAYYPWLRSDPSYPRWLLTDADARRRLVNWETDWAAPLLTQMRIAQALHPQDAGIAALVDACLETSPEARCLWNAHAAYGCALRSRRGIRLSEHRTTLVDVVTLTDPSASELQIVSLIPVAEAA
ncbi:helix-turn-helix domain-containing protein [Micromonospora carbonacea]|uniref:Helix-turn-helix domain-containing protein n=1 Tax=Micromonospora carbonacea TaxID=47853 RepID=A0A7H8XGT6_9ACTN|nr:MULTISPECIES: helix-turn-helix domain-containing protein [Micromonospora]MBB5828450.1 transcriptional regulator with XRE-family HTH domain [Micromonospora carbonacea]MDG4817649.1 helix-turn-helix domain-containing protein [Micromonospora sp. WMMD956]QLD23945.1 helix-turn-helix domain-containing protein [Micromonospora carbonacea]WFE60242.1 helix-turn-helix domain-containing protein [Micromonospora sp. WMMD712]